MLAALSIRDVVLIDRLEILFKPGFTVLTGETGAGKSVLLDALSLALGARGAASLVRSGQDNAVVSAAFDVPIDHPVRTSLAAHGLDDEGDVILRRIQARDGRSRAFINDQPVSIAVMREIGAMLVELHGQHDDRALIDTGQHRLLLDAFGDLNTLIKKTATAFATLSEANQALARTKAQVAKSQSDFDYLTHAVEELQTLAPIAGEEDELASKRQRLMRAESMMADLQEAQAAMDEPSSTLAALARRLQRRADTLPGVLDDTLNGLDRALAGLEEAQRALHRLIEESTFSAQDLEAIEERLFALRQLARKHNIAPDALGSLLAGFVADLAAIDAHEQELKLREIKANEALAAYHKAAATLSNKRKRIAKSLASAVNSELPALKLKEARFSVHLASDPERIAETGYDRIEFWVQTNPGTLAGPMIKVASGGELSRLLLALKVVLADKGSAPCLVFDEIDTGAGGAVADAIGKRLFRLGQNVQTLAITHAPQVAARAQHHCLITKSAASRKLVVTDLTVLDEAERREELARMLAGAKITSEARAAADKLLTGTHG